MNHVELKCILFLEWNSCLLLRPCNQGYPANLVNDQFSKVSIIPRKDLLKQKARTSKRLFPFVTAYNSNLPNINYIIRKHLHLLESNTKLKKLFPKNSIIPAYRRSKNLKEILAPSKYQTGNIHTTNPLEQKQMRPL